MCRKQQIPLLGSPWHAFYFNHHPILNSSTICQAFLIGLSRNFLIHVLIFKTFFLITETKNLKNCFNPFKKRIISLISSQFPQINTGVLLFSAIHLSQRRPDITTSTHYVTLIVTYSQFKAIILFKPAFLYFLNPAGKFGKLPSISTQHQTQQKH